MMESGCLTNKGARDSSFLILQNELMQFDTNAFYMCNLYGLISSKPGKLFEVSDSQGDNIEWLQNIGQRVDEVIFCWGSFKRIEYRAKTAIEMFPNAKCFGRSKNGSPTHPMALMWGGIKIEKTRLEPYSESKIQAPYPFLKGSD